jgi:hypothetical protein
MNFELKFSSFAFYSAYSVQKGVGLDWRFYISFVVPVAAGRLLVWAVWAVSELAF